MVRIDSNTTSTVKLDGWQQVAGWFRFCQLALLILVMVGLQGCGSNSPTVPRSADGKLQVEIALNWIPDAQHGGFYAAQALGFFEDAGLEVTLTPGGPNSPVLQKVADAQTPILGVANADQVLTAREVGMPIKAVLAAMQDSPRCIIVRKSSAITSLRDLKNVTLAVGAGKTFVKYLEKHVDLSGVTVASYTGSLVPFLNDPNYAQQGYVFSEPLVLAKDNVETTNLMVSEIGFNPYSSCLIVNEHWIHSQPELVRQVTQEVQRGWQTYLDSPEAANRLIHQDNPAMEIDFLNEAVSPIRRLCLPDGLAKTELGQMTMERWTTLENQLRELGLVTAVSASDAFDNRFLSQAD